jgi:hypothetical protein
MQVICECHPKPDEDIRPSVRKAIDGGASLVYVHGGLADGLIDQARVDIIAQAVDCIKQNKVPAGVGGHCLQVPIECEKFAVEPDFYVKTLHHDNYWSANPTQFRTEPTKGSFGEHHKSHDNIWCINPQETIDFMKDIERPWIAFKVLAAGAIHPNDGFKFAYENGVDFICAGMFDFQVAEDAAIAKNVLAELSKTERTRPWRA